MVSTASAIAMTKYKVFCSEHPNWKIIANGIYEARHFEGKHYSQMKCLEAKHERISSS
jgi:hypothetical protein